MTTRPPAVNDLALEIADCGLPHPLCVQAARAAVRRGREPEHATLQGTEHFADRAAYVRAARAEAATLSKLLLRYAVNATGVLLHTNLGRAPLQHRRSISEREQAADAQHSRSATAVRATNLEFDLASGRRGSRADHLSMLLTELTGAQAAVAVNNCAAAVTLVLAALAAGRGAAVSRGELVEIGGGFRIPEVIEQSGARLVEVGTTNRTRAADYRAACESHDVALLLKVHPSNYRISGFVEQASVQALAQIGPPVVADLGSGLLDARCPWLKGTGGPPAWLSGEPAVRQTLTAGAALVTFSGDKLLGGPQAGIICGRADLVAACAAHPLMRAVRPGGLVLAALQDTLLAYLRRDADAIPFWRMAAARLPELSDRAAALGVGRPARTTALAGAGSLAGQAIPSAGIELDGDHTAALRAFDPPVIARVEDSMTVLDLRTVDPADDPVVTAAVRHALDRSAGRSA